MADTSKQRVLFYDTCGLFTHVAEAIAPDVGAVQYFSEWKQSSRDALPGVGLDGVERVNDFFEVLPKADILVFPDVGRIGLQTYLKAQGYPVWGSGLGARLEQDRWAFRTVLKECGLPVTNAIVVRGLDNLRDHLRDVEDRYIKFSYFRGDFETYHHEAFFASQTWLDDLGARLGVFASVAEFIVEEPIDDGDAVEVGIDGFLVDGELVPHALMGYEVKDSAYLGTTAQLPARLLTAFAKLQPVLREINYTGPFCTESRCTEDDDYLIDFTARNGSPPSESQCINIENLAEIMCEGAQGRIVTPQYRKPYVAQLILHSPWAQDHTYGIEIGRHDRVCVHGHCRFDGQDYAVSPSGYEECISAVGIGETVSEAIADCFDAADSVHGYQLSYDGSAFDKALECIQNGEKLELAWGVLDEDTRAA